MSTESHWTFNRGRGGSTRSDGVSFNPALKWDGDVDDPIKLSGEGAEWCWEVRFPGKTGHKVINPDKKGLYTPLAVQEWLDRKYPMVEVEFVSGETEIMNLTTHTGIAGQLEFPPIGQLQFDWVYSPDSTLLDFPEGSDK
jgi:hypothetical protein